MDTEPSRAVYLGFARHADGVRLSALDQHGAECLLSWPATARPAEVEAELTRLRGVAGSGDVFLWDADLLADLVGSGAPARTIRPLLERAHDLLAAALIVLPTETDYAPRAIATALGLPLPGDDDPLREARLCRALADALRAQLPALSPAVLVLLGGLLASHHDLVWLEPQRAELPPIEPSALELLVDARPAVPKPRARRPEDLGAPLRDLARELLDEHGPIATSLEAYEHRPGQIQMAQAVARALEGDGFLMVEAGTGVGKSLAYLVPGVLFSRARAEPVVISTNTKNLQEQLVHKDLPLLARALPLPFEAALVKGRANYACPRRFMTLVREAQGSLFPDEQAAAAFLVSWMAASESADLDGVPAEARSVFPPLRDMVDRLRSERTSCLGPGCPQAGVCPMRVARALGRNADIIISNHALTLADAGGDVLPRYSRIIFDEAHNLEDVATDQLGSEVNNFSFAGLRRTFSGDGRMSGLADALSVAAAGGQMPSELGRLSGRLDSLVRMLEDAGEDLGAAVIAFCNALSPDRSGGRAGVRLDAGARATPQWEPLVRTAARCRIILQEITAVLAQTGEALQQAGPETAGAADLALEAAAARTSVMELEAALNAALAEEDVEAPQFVCWAEVRWRGRATWWRLCAAPIQVGPALQRAVYQRRATVVMTSATLTVDDSFEYMSQRLGLRGEPRLTATTVPSPFDLPEQLLICVPQDLPVSGDSAHREAVAEAIVRIAHLARGGMLVLFTSRLEMDAVHGRTAARLRDLGLQPLCQYASGPRSALLARMRGADDVVLFGLKSFWEGVDVPGEALRCVVMVKLPFAVPSEPIVVARCEQVARDGLDSSNDYYIPEAIIGFRQGIGRLIRTTTDRGVVFALDGRLITRGYGHRFLSSIPRCAFATGSFDECLDEARHWL